MQQQCHPVREAIALDMLGHVSNAPLVGAREGSVLTERQDPSLRSG